MTTITAKKVADSVVKLDDGELGSRITTIEVEFPRIILAEVNTHRLFSRNYSSTRAIPILSQLETISNNPAMPVFYGKKQSGMVAEKELNDTERQQAEEVILDMLEYVSNGVKKLDEIGLHKQHAGRYLEPWMHVKGVITSTEWENFLWLRNHCFSDDTEVLTTSGWKYIKDVSIGEEVYALDKKTKKLEKTEVTDTVSWKSDGTGVHFLGQGVDLITSDGHNQLVVEDGALVIEKSIDLVGTNPTLYKTCAPDKYDINSHEYKFGKLLGFYLGNGWTSHKESSGNYGTYICKGGVNRQKIISDYAGLVKLIFPSVTTGIYDKGGVSHLYISGKDVYNLFQGLGQSTTKHIPIKCWDWSQSSLMGIFDGLMDADSNIHSQSGGLKYYTSSKQLADDVQRLSLMVGYSATIGVDCRIGGNSRGVSPTTGIPYDITTKNLGYRVSINKKRNSPKLKNPVSEVAYSGDFVCVTLKEHNTLYVRRNGKAVWSGNCDAQPEFQMLAQAIYDALQASVPVQLSVGDWHTPYYGRGYWINHGDGGNLAGDSLEDALKISASCCAQVSYRKNDNSFEKAEQVFGRLNIGVGGDSRCHASPVEHQATPIIVNDEYNGSTAYHYDLGHMSGNLVGWQQYRQTIDGHVKW